jgi:DNA-directed RNA polymerase-5 subunit 1
LALVRTDQEKARYTFLDDVDYLVEDNAMDDICLSPELDGTLECPLLNIAANIDTSEESEFRKNGATVNSSWEKNASS